MLSSKSTWRLESKISSPSPNACQERGDISASYRTSRANFRIPTRLSVSCVSDILGSYQSLWPSMVAIHLTSHLRVRHAAVHAELKASIAAKDYAMYC